MDNLITRGVNQWWNSGGIWSDISITNVSGATLAAAAAVWIEDSIPLFTILEVSKSDNGIIVRHISETTTRPTFLDTKIEDCQYRGILVERLDHSNFSNLQTNAIFTGLEVRGTGGQKAKTPGRGIGASFDAISSGAKVPFDAKPSWSRTRPVRSWLMALSSGKWSACSTKALWVLGEMNC